MIQHTIVFKVKSNATYQAIQEAMEQMISLKDKLPSILHIAAGECQFHDERSKAFFEESISHAISIDFENEEALTQFFTKLIAYPAKGSMVNIAEGGMDRIVGFEFMHLEKTD